MPSEQPRPRRTFDEAFKCDAVTLRLKRELPAWQLAQDTGLSHWNLRDWRLQDGPVAPALVPNDSTTKSLNLTRLPGVNC